MNRPRERVEFFRPWLAWVRRQVHLIAPLALATLAASAIAQGTDDSNTNSRTAVPGISNTDISGPVRLRNAPSANDLQRQDIQRTASPEGYLRPASEAPPPYVPGEFELFVRKLLQNAPGAPAEQVSVRRFGADLVTGAQAAVDYSAQVPPDYIVSPGDELQLTVWGSVDADLRLSVDRSGRVNIPRVGSVLVAGVRYADLPAVISQRIGQVFRNFQISVALSQLRSIRIYVTGFTPKPGSYTVSSLSTIVNALMRTGGPSAAGSFRNVSLYRGGQRVTTFDLYDLLLRGDKSADRVLQAEDVVQIGPVGPQVALLGSVNRPAIFELKPGETVSDVIAMAGGFTAVADRSRLAVQHLEDRNDARIVQIALPARLADKPANGDVLRAFSLVEVTLAVQRQNKRVRVEGEVGQPGEYILSPGSTVNDALRAAGGLTPMAYVFGTEFDRESVRVTQQQNYDRALRDLETSFTLNTSTQRTANADEATAQGARAQATSRLIERLRAVQPNGRIVLQISPETHALPDLTLEEGDRIYVPPMPTTVGVFGSVFNGGSYLWRPELNLGDYLQRAGGPTKGADTGSSFVIRANGSVVSSRQQGTGWFGLGMGSIERVKAEPGDTIFVPEELDKTTFTQTAKDWTQILYQFGLGAAALKTIKGN